MARISQQEDMMSYSLDQFCKDANAIMNRDASIQERIDDVAAKLSGLLVDEDFVKATFDDAMEPGKRELYHDPDHDFYVLAHVQQGGKRGNPHSHGASWAIYGNINGATRMREYKRTNSENEEAHVLEKIAEYDLTKGVTKAYGPGHIHATEHPEKCWVIRITGTDLDQIPRYRFRNKVMEAA
jgi:predicted metal-dependent enzyme (double-stranded beta helix superfamily)